MLFFFLTEMSVYIEQSIPSLALNNHVLEVVSLLEGKRTKKRR